MGRKRINLPCAEIFARAGADIRIHQGVLGPACAVLYREDVRREIDRLRNADDAALQALNAESARKRVQWFRKNRGSFNFIGDDPIESAYRLLLARFGITEEQAPVISRTEREIVFHSMNFCPTLEACRILGLDTRHVCRRLNEAATDALVKQVDGRLTFFRHYENLRPYAGYCEEGVRIAE